jgi:hypothetical protein
MNYVRCVVIYRFDAGCLTCPVTCLHWGAAWSICVIAVDSYRAVTNSVNCHPATCLTSLEGFLMSTDAEIKALRDEVSQLQQQLAELKQRSEWVTDVVTPERAHGAVTMPIRGQSSTEVRKVIEDAHALDFRQELNTSSYVNVSFEDDE